QAAFTKQQGRASLVGAGLGAAGAYAMHKAGGSGAGGAKTDGTGANAIQHQAQNWRL
ncbi:hypothetical protein RYF66_005322, partial [Escherichia coli]|nr:hypothetical protein [Escherichia coli]